MAKRTAAVWLETELYERLHRIATVDRRSISEVISMAIEHGLPPLEGELKHKLTPVLAESHSSPINQAIAAAGAGPSLVYSRRKKHKLDAVPKP